MLSDRILIPKELARHRFVDDGDRRRRAGVCGIEAAAAANRDAHRLEVVVHRAAELHFRQLGGGQRIALALQRGRHRRAAERHTGGAPDRHHAGQRFHPREEVPIEHEAIGVADQVRRQVHLPGEHSLGLEARIDVRHRHEAAQQQPGSGRDRDGERDFGDHECGAGAASEPAPNGSAAGVLQAGLRVDRRRAHRRQHAHEEAGEDRRERRRQQHAPVDRDFVDARDVGRRQRDERGQRRPHHQQTGDPRNGREQQAFGEQLSRDPRPASPQRDASRQLLFTGDAAGEQQIRDVHRRHDQHERDAGEQDHQRRTDRPDGLIDRWARRLRSSPCS